MAEKWGKCLGYVNRPCPSCGRVRLEAYENGKEVCQKCGWCPQDGEYIDVEVTLEVISTDAEPQSEGFLYDQQ